uniref:Coatomer subunit delta n=1 Tax=Chenopodium quinoa TaxID=63459 RepID=A0A803KTK3_CHEQI
MAFELIFAFDEVISLGHRENVTVTQVKQFCKMESEEEKLHKIVLQNKIKETKENMKHKAIDIDKSKAESSRGGKGGFMSLQSMGSVLIERPLDDLSISSSNSGSGNASGLSAFGSSTDLESYSNQPKGLHCVISHLLHLFWDPSAAHSATFKGQGMQLGKNQRTNQFLQSLKAEGEEIIEDLQPSLIKSRAVIPPPSDPVTLVVEEKLFVTLKRDGGLANFDVQGTLSLQILEEKDDYLHVQVESGNKPSILFKTHPNINKELFSNESILGLKDPNRPFPTGQSVDGVGLLKWKMQSLDESAIPLTISCWPSVSGNVTDVSIEYEASSNFDLQNVIISVPLPSLKQAPNVRQIDGGWRNDSKNSVFEWSILLIDNSNRSGSVEFAVPAADSSAFFPISVQFSAVNTFSGLKGTLRPTSPQVEPHPTTPGGDRISTRMPFECQYPKQSLADDKDEVQVHDIELISGNKGGERTGGMQKKINTWFPLTSIVSVIQRKQQIDKRERYGLKSKSPMTQHCYSVGLHNLVKRRASGYVVNDVEAKAHELYVQKREGGQPFVFYHCWVGMQHLPRWMSGKVSTVVSEGSSKRSSDEAGMPKRPDGVEKVKAQNKMKGVAAACMDELNNNIGGLKDERGLMRKGMSDMLEY